MYFIKTQGYDAINYQGNFSGKVVGYVSVIEFQKRGLTHSHILVILECAFKPTKIGHYDRLVCAKLFDKTIFFELHDTLYNVMFMAHVVH